MGVLEWLMMFAVQSPVLLFWIAVLIFGIVMLQRGGGRAERFFIAGASVKILGNLLNIPRFATVLWIIPERPISSSDVTTILSVYDLFVEIIGMAGILLLIYAFWVKFNEKKPPVENAEQP